MEPIDHDSRWWTTRIFSTEDFAEATGYNTGTNGGGRWVRRTMFIDCKWQGTIWKKTGMGREGIFLLIRSLLSGMDVSEFQVSSKLHGKVPVTNEGRGIYPFLEKDDDKVSSVLSVWHIICVKVWPGSHPSKSSIFYAAISWFSYISNFNPLTIRYKIYSSTRTGAYIQLTSN